jgi:two-component system, OmpR family, sensor kinase
MDLPDALWRETLEALPSEIALLDSDGTILFTNRGWRDFGRQNGLVGEEAASLGENYLAVTETADDEHAGHAFDGLRALLAGERSQFSLEYPCHSPDEQRWFRMSARLLEYGDDRYVVMEHLDITGRKLAELTVHEKSERLEALHRAAQELLRIESREGAATFALTTIKEVLEMSIGGLWLYAPDRDVLEPVAATEEARTVVGDHPTYRREESLSRRAFAENTTYVFDELSKAPGRYNLETSLRSEMILPLGSHGVLNIGATDAHAFDETDVTLAEIWAVTVTQVLSRIEREQELHERERDLTRERDRLEQFADLLSHDLRTPLTVATRRLELASGECDSGHLADVDRALNRMEQLIRDLLMLAREGEAVGETEPVRVAEFASRCWATVETRHATLHPGTDLTVRADESRLAQVFENLFRNAIEHGGDDVMITVGELEDEIGFFVEDDGPGVPEDGREEVFESGYSTSADGTGFGLAIVKRIVEAHGWKIAATEGASGARFEITGVESAEG